MVECSNCGVKIGFWSNSFGCNIAGCEYVICSACKQKGCLQKCKECDDEGLYCNKHLTHSIHDQYDDDELEQIFFEHGNYAIIQVNDIDNGFKRFEELKKKYELLSLAEDNCGYNIFLLKKKGVEEK